MRGTPVNATTDWDKIPKCALSGVLDDVMLWILRLRSKLEPLRCILVQKMGVKSAFRQVGVDPAGAANFGSIFRNFVVIDLRLQFRWRDSPGWSGLLGSAAEHAQKGTTRRSADVLETGREATDHLCVVLKPDGNGRPIPRDVRVPRAKGGGPTIMYGFGYLWTTRFPCKSSGKKMREDAKTYPGH